METTCPRCEPHVVTERRLDATTSLRCSIILPASATASQVTAYLRRLGPQNIRSDHEVLTSERAPAARGKYLLFVRELAAFDVARLDQAVRGLEAAGSAFHVSPTGKFVLVERSFYRRVGGLGALLEQACSAPSPGPAAPRQSVCRVKGLNNASLDLVCGPDTSIDPDVVIDSPERVRIGAHCIIRKGVVLRPEGGTIVIGAHCVINHYCVLHAKGGIYIGDWTIIAPHCGLYAQNHTFERFDVPITRQPNVGKGIYLMGDNWLGAGTVVCDDVTLGKGAVVGANATVTRSIPMAAVAVGSPARVIRKRCGPSWDFRQRERAACAGMPQEICDHVAERGRRLAALLGPQDVVLDVGCGEGIITALLAPRCRQVIGCDYSREAVATATKQFPGIQFVYSNSTCLRFENASFTQVVLSDVAEHLLPVQLEKTLDEADRVLRTGGSLLLATPLTGKGVRTSTYTHIYEYSAHEIEALLGRIFDEVRLQDGRFGIWTARKR
jgi:acetyltransferase-like isoleucine patch superfamily enzyme